MTGTAETEAAEFREIYKLDVSVVPTHRPWSARTRPTRCSVPRRRNGRPSRPMWPNCTPRATGPGGHGVHREEREARRHAQETRRQARGVERQVPRGRPRFIALAGQPGAVTIATNMAGRGTDIQLGPGVKELGGLAVIGTERHESRVSTTSCAVAPGARATRVFPASMCRSRTT
jgi:preprotein translocase subunit SecA